MNVLNIDIETFSEVDLVKTGVYPYARHPSFEILIFAFSWNGADEVVIDLAQGEPLPHWVYEALWDPNVLKTAQNAAFEMTCIEAYYGREIIVNQWQDTMILASMIGLPMSLAGLGKALGDEQKDSEGKALITYFSKPCKPTKANGFRTRNLPHHAPDKWQRYLYYCGQDVKVERTSRDTILKQPVDFAREMNNWHIDQAINRRGIKINTQMAENIIQYFEVEKDNVLEELKTITGLQNPNSGPQLLGWLKDFPGIELPDMRAATIEQALKELDPRSEAAHVLSLKQFLGKSSIKKYESMLSYTYEVPDKRARGTFQFCGARTWRWAGRGIQLQNLPRMFDGKLFDNLDATVLYATRKDFPMLEIMYDDMPSLLSQLVRTGLIAEEGKNFFVSDFSAIEARVLAWVVGETWRIDVFKGDGRIYEASASMMFNVPIEEIGHDSPLRQQGKVAELALGYGGGPGALETMDFGGKVRPDLSDEAVRTFARENFYAPNTNPDIIKRAMIEANYDDLKEKWRTASPNVVSFWRDMETAAVGAISNPGFNYPVRTGVGFHSNGEYLYMYLPSGRSIAYPSPMLKTKTVYPKAGQDFKPFETQEIRFKTMVGNSWKYDHTYGGKLTENCIQAIARDILMDKIRDIELNYPEFKIVGHVHDEIITEADASESLEKLDAILRKPVEWADANLVLDSAGFVSPYYKKD